jgi:acetyl-CoA acetyltransferase
LKGTKRVALVGAALSDIGRVDTKTPYELHYQAASRAIADAGLTKNDIDGLASSGTGLLTPVEIGEYLGLRPTWVDGTGVGGSTWEFMVEHATAAILAGQRDRCARLRIDARADLKARRRSANLSFGARGPVQFDARSAHAHLEVRDGRAPPHARVRHDHRAARRDRGVARYNASAQPRGLLRDPITIDDVQSERMMADPLTKLHCCIRSDGGGASCSPPRNARATARKPPVWILGTGEDHEHNDHERVGDFTESPAVRSGALAFERAGVTPDDIDCCQLYDAFTPMVLETIEAMGFCKRGEGGPFVEDGKLRVGGALPTNTDGAGSPTATRGCVACSCSSKPPPAARRGARPPGRNAQLCCVNGTGGWFSSASTVILGAS